jgi:hypothetical protein
LKNAVKNPEAAFSHMANEETTEKIIKELKRIEEDALCFSKSHFNAAQIWANWHLWLGIPATVLSAIAGVSALSLFDYHDIVSGILAILVAGITALITFLNPNERAEIHVNAGNAYNQLRNNTRIVYEIDAESGIITSFTEKLKQLNNKRNELNSQFPRPPMRAFEKARKEIEKGEAEYNS